MTRVCMLSSSYPRYSGDGAGSFIASLAIELAAQGHEVHVAAPWDPAVEPRDEQGVIVHRFRYARHDEQHIVGHGRSLQADRTMKGNVPLRMPAYIWQALHTVRKLHRQYHFDVIHGQWAVPSGAIAAIASVLCDIPLVISMHGSDVYVMEKSKLYRLAGRMAFARSRQVTACSQDLLSRAQTIGLDGGLVISYGVDAARFNRTPTLEAVTRKAWGIDTATPIIGAIGRLVHKKGFDVLLNAMPSVLEQMPDAVCVIGGDGDLRRALETQAYELGVAEHVRFLGHVSWEQSPGFYAACDAFVLPSVIDRDGNVDGLPNVLLEAMSSECPIVATRIGGVPSVITNERTGLLIESRDEKALVVSLIELLRDKKKATLLGNQARAFALENLSWEKIATRYNTIYTQVVAP